MSRKIVALLVLVLFGALMSACGPSEVSEADVVDASSDYTSSMSDCEAQLDTSWQHMGDAKVTHLVTIRPNCIGSDSESDWTEAFEKASGMTWAEYEAAQ